MPRISDKRERLIEAAKSLFHKQGFTNTTLAHIAKYSDVPLGNVYYYFKTKEEIGAAVIDTRHAEISKLYVDWKSTIKNPRDRLFCYLDNHEQTAELVAENGCPVGSLCQELNKDQRTALSKKADDMLETQLEWLKEQFEAMGKEDAVNLAMHIVVSLQGGSLLANALRNKSILLDQVIRLRELVEKL